MSPSRLVCPCCCSAFGIHYRCETVISFTLLQHIVLVQGLLLAVSLGLFFAHGLWLAWYGRRYQPLLERTQATIGTVVLGGTALPPTEYEWLCALPVRLQIRLFTHLAPSLSGAKKQQLTALAHASGLLAWAATRCRSQWWWRRLQGARLFTLLGGGEHVVPVLFLDRAALVRAQAAEWAVEHPTPAVIKVLLLLLGDAESLCRFAAQDALVRLGPLVAEPLVHLLGVYHRVGHLWPLRMTAGIETALEVAVGLADARFFSPALTLCHSATPGVRALAATLLGALGGREGVEVLTALLDDDVPEVRAAEVLTALLDDDVPEVRAAAARALGKLRYWPAAAALATLLRDRAWDVRREVGLALRSLGPPGLLFLHRSLQDADRFAADMARHMLDLPDMASPKAPV
jgi:HEAT repeat protein